MKIATWLFLLIPLLLSACGVIRIQSIDSLESEAEVSREPAPINFHNQSPPAQPVVQTPDPAPQLELVSANSSFPEVVDTSSSVQELYDIEQAPLVIPAPPNAELAQLVPEAKTLPEANQAANLPAVPASESLPIMPDSPTTNIAPSILIESQIEADEANTTEAPAAPVEPEAPVEPAAPATAAISVEASANSSDINASATTHLVVSGETVFSISQRYGKSVEQIAELNNISAPAYLIYPGTRLLLEANNSSSESAEPVEQYASYEVVSGDTIYSIARRYQMTPDDLAELNNISIPEYAIYPGNILKVNNVEVVAEANVASSDDQPAVANNEEPQIDWQWPLVGAIQQSRLQGLPGILISSEIAAPVRAAGSGTVVFAGNEIRPIGLMVIIEHGNNYLSVYGNLQQILVAKDDAIAAGQRLGDLDNSGQLYFEIRRGSQYIDPRDLLPEL